jgi:hypothetical protein
MTFNYYHNKSILGKNMRDINLGIVDINYLMPLFPVEYVSATIINQGCTPTFITNDITGTSQAKIYGNNYDSVSGQIDITYQVNSTTYLNWNFQVSSEGSYDYGSFLLNGNSLAYASGEITTNGKTLMPTGTNILRLIYSKDSSSTSGTDSTIVTWSFTIS